MPKAKTNAFYIPSIDDLLRAGAQFGHSTQRWHPAFKPFIYKRRANIYIINVEKTIAYLKKAAEALYKMLDADPDLDIVIVGTKKQAQEYVKELGEKYGLFYVDRKWPAGLLTNFEKVQESIERLLQLKERYIRQKYQLTKKELLDIKRKIERLERKFGGLTFMRKLPDLIIIIDTKREEVALSEARKLGIPTIAIVDSNSDPRLVDYPIPMNDDARRALGVVLETFKKIFEEKRGDKLLKLREKFNEHLKELEKKIDQEFGILREAAEGKKEETKETVEVVRVKAYTPLEELGLSSNVVERLKLAGISSVEELLRRSPEEIKAIRGIGRKTAEKIISLLKEYESRH